MPRRKGSALRLDLDLDEHELKIVGVDHVVLDARLTQAFYAAELARLERKFENLG